MEAQGGKFLTFTLANEVYGIPIKKVKEIIGIMEITNIPKTNECVKGVINLRGKIIPIIDLRLKFGMEEKPYTERTCIIVIEIFLSGIQKLIGVVVDAVAEVLNIQSGEIEPSLEYETQIGDNFLTGIGKVKEKIVLILEIEKILNVAEIISIKKEQAALGEPLNNIV